MNPPATARRSERTTEGRRRHQARIVRSYPSLVLRLYCRIRFLIIRRRFLDAIGQYLPERGHVLDIGCGFGLAGLYFCGFHPDRALYGYDLDQRRIATARVAAESLGLSNAHFAIGNAATLDLERKFDAAYAIDLIHHLPRAAVPEFLEGIHRRLQPGGRLVIKDVDNRPAYKRWCSWITDRVMVGFREPIYYWPTEELSAVLRNAGFKVSTSPMPDILPYPHVLYVCEKSLPPDEPVARETPAPRLA